MKFACVFPGQGSQTVGMCRDLHERFPEVRHVFEEASGAVGWDIGRLCFNGPREELDRTRNTQPCLLTASIASYKALTLHGIVPEVAAGHSLGEYSALVAAGALELGDAVRIVEQRGIFMQEAVPEGSGMMAALLGIDREVVDNLCTDNYGGSVSVANYNCPGQIVISGEKQAVETLIEKARNAGARKVVPLSVSVPSHSALMEPAAKRLAELLASVTIKAPRIPVISNASAQTVTDPEEILHSLVRQISGPVFWEDSVRAILRQGITVFVETGPGKVISGLIRKIDPSTRQLFAGDTQSLEETLVNLKVKNAD